MEHVPGPKDSGGDADLLAVRVLVERRSLRVVLAGELDLGEVATIHREVRRALDTWPGPPVAKLDLSHLRFIDVAGLRALADACRVLQRSARTFDVIGVPRPARGGGHRRRNSGDERRPEAEKDRLSATNGRCGPGRPRPAESESHGGSAVARAELDQVTQLIHHPQASPGRVLDRR